MTKGDLLKRLFVRFLLRQEFIECEFTQIWELFVQKRYYLDTKESFEFINSFFKSFLEEDYFIVDTKPVPFKYTSAYREHQLMTFLVPEEFRLSYESICQKMQKVEKTIHQKELEIEFLNGYYKEFPAIQFQIDILIKKRQEEKVKLQSNINVLQELIQTFI
ncbi:hypothetical protein [Acinetobacter calcoaceticus]|jgi:hypothetical protein